MTLKQIFQLEKHTLRVFTWKFKEIIGKGLFGSFIQCLFRFVLFLVIFNDLSCWTQGCGLLSRIHLRVTDQSWQTSPNESVLHFKVLFVVCWHQIEKLVQVVYITIILLLFKLHKLSSSVRLLKILKQIFRLESSPCMVFHAILKRLFARFGFDASFMCLSQFLIFVVLSTIYAVERNFVVYCHAYNYKQRTKVGTLVQFNLHYILKLFLQFADVKFRS